MRSRTRFFFGLRLVLQTFSCRSILRHKAVGLSKGFPEIPLTRIVLTPSMRGHGG
jgi:hypothetical protein